MHTVGLSCPVQMAATTLRVTLRGSILCVGNARALDHPHVFTWFLKLEFHRKFTFTVFHFFLLNVSCFSTSLKVFCFLMKTAHVRILELPISPLILRGLGENL